MRVLPSTSLRQREMGIERMCWLSGAETNVLQRRNVAFDFAQATGDGD